MFQGLRFITLGTVAMLLVASMAAVGLLAGQQQVVSAAPQVAVASAPLVIPQVLALPAESGPAVVANAATESFTAVVQPQTVASVAAQGTSVQYILARGDVNIRSGPGMNYRIVGWVAAGQTARVTGLSNDGLWWRVICPDGTAGSCWVTARSQYTQPTTGPGTGTGEVIVARTGVNIRRGPGMNFQVIGWLSAGQTARVTGKSSNGLWWRVACPNGSAGDCWVTARPQYTRLAAAPTPGPLPTPVQYIMAQTDVNIRRGPATTYGVIGWVAAGQIARVTGISNDGLWWRVVCPDGSTGSCWVTAIAQYTRPTTTPGS